MNSGLNWRYFIDFNWKTTHPKAGNSETLALEFKVDGRILVDGPADNSQNWSDSLSSAGGFTGNAYGPKAGFDNDTTTFCQANTSTDLVWTPATPITVTSKIEMFTKSNSAYNNKILINGVDTGVLNLPGGGGCWKLQRSKLYWYFNVFNYNWRSVI